MGSTLDERLGRDLPAGKVLFRQGDPGQHMFVIQSGRIAICRERNGVEAVLAVLPPGEFFGEMALLNGAPRSATARVVEDARLLVIDANTFGSMIRGSAEIAARLIQRLAARLEQANRQIETLMFRDPASRVVHCLRQEADGSGGKQTPAGLAVRLDIGHLAARLGLAVAEVRQVLERLEAARLVSRGNDGTLILAESGKLLEFLEFVELQERHGAGTPDRR